MLSQPFPAAFDAAIDLAHKHQLGLPDGQPMTEILVCLSNDGTYVIDASVGEPDKVQLTKKMLHAARSAEGCRLVHNHPKRGSLSAADWRLALKYNGIHEIVAVNYRKSIFRGAPNHSQSGTFGSFVRGHDLSAQIGVDVFQRLWSQFNQALSNGEELPSPAPLEQALDWIWSHLVNERFREKCYVAYCADLGSDDMNELNDSCVASIIQDGRGKIAAAVV